LLDERLSGQWTCIPRKCTVSVVHYNKKNALIANSLPKIAELTKIKLTKEKTICSNEPGWQMTVVFHHLDTVVLA
jgi:hypothetical protein